MTIEKKRGYCAQCASYCPTISHVEDGIFVKVEPDRDHPNANDLCPKGLAGPELVYNKQRLQHPMKRTRPKGDPDPGWERISWDEAMDTIAERLLDIKKKYGPEAVAMARPSNSGSPSSDFNPWAYRLAYAFGTPNSIATTHICQWHRDRCSEYTFGKAGIRWGEGLPDFDRARCILIWGKNLHATDYSRLRDVKEGLKNGAKLIVIDPRKTKTAEMADHWLQVCPGTDGALALSMINIMIDESLFDLEFVRDWTTAPFLVRSDSGDFLRGNDLDGRGNPQHYVAVDSNTGHLMTYAPGSRLPADPRLDANLEVALENGERVECKTAFTKLREHVSEFHPCRSESITWIPEKALREAVRTFAREKPACMFTWNGIEQSICASQTNRAICILYAMSGDFDKPGANTLLPSPTTNPVVGHDLLDDATRKKRLGYKERPLGPTGTVGLGQAYDFYEAVLTGKPYPVKALLSIGGNLISTNPDSKTGREALVRLDFHVQGELFMTPSAELADLVLPAASFWESWHVRSDFIFPRARGHIQYRPAVVPPQHESRPDMTFIFDLAKRLGVGDKFWDGDIEAGFNFQLAPLNITVENLRNQPGGITVDLPEEYQKYKNATPDGTFQGFNSPSRKMEIYSQTFKDFGYDPLPIWEPPLFLRKEKHFDPKKYPLILTSGKLLQYCHSEHRAIPSLRKAVPHPYVEIHPDRATDLGIQSGEWVALETPFGSITLQARLTDTIDSRIVSTQHGWWQGCEALNLPGYDSYSSEGANLNLILSAEEIDPISGSLPMKGYPCRLRKKELK